MFEQDYFNEEETSSPGRAGQVMGGVGTWGLHVAKVAFLIYSGYHGISATATYRGSSELAAAAGIVGIIVVEITLFSIYLAWHNQRITGAAQSIAAAVTYVIGFGLACMGIIADSQIHAGLELSSWLLAYLHWGLPVAPAMMAFGALLIHELAPEQLQARKELADKLDFAEQQFQARMANLRAEMGAFKIVRNVQLNARTNVAKQIAAWYSSEQAQQAIADTAMQNAPALLRAIGVQVNELPPLPQEVHHEEGQEQALDPAQVADYLAQHPDVAVQLFGLLPNIPPDGTVPSVMSLDEATPPFIGFGHEATGEVEIPSPPSANGATPRPFGE